MQAWIPVVSSSLYFWKSVFSFRVDSILKWRVYIKLKVSWLRAFLWCMSQTSRDRDNSRRVRTHEKNSGETVRRLGTIITKHFLCPIRTRHPLEFLEIARWESVPRGTFARTWNLSSLLFSQPDWLPRGRPRRLSALRSYSFVFELFWKISSYVSGLSVRIFVALYVRLFVAGANKVEGTMSWCVGTMRFWDHIFFKVLPMK